MKKKCPNKNNNPNCKKKMKQGPTCPSCSRYKKPKSKEHIANMIKSLKGVLAGKKNPMYGKSVYSVWLEKYGKEEADKRQKRYSKNMSKAKSGKFNSMYNSSIKELLIKKHGKEKGKELWNLSNKKRSMSTSGKKNGMFNHKYTDETRKKMRLSAINRIEKRVGKLSTNYNKNACEIFNWINSYYDLNLQHAENGGEYRVEKLGYFLDSYDIKNNIVIEFYEKKHYRSGKLSNRDLRREQEIINNLGCEFIRIHGNTSDLMMEKIS